MIHPLLILSLIVSLAVNWKFKARRKLIAITFSIYLVVLVISSLYFIPGLIAFSRSNESNLTPFEWLARANRWQYLSWIRGTVCYLAFIPLLIALTKSLDAPKESETATVGWFSLFYHRNFDIIPFCKFNCFPQIKRLTNSVWLLIQKFCIITNVWWN